MTQFDGPGVQVAGAKATGSNAAWLVGERVVQLAMAFVVSIVVARELGPARYGELAVALALLLLVSGAVHPAVQCLMRDLIDEPDEAGNLFASSALAVAMITYLAVLIVGVVTALTVGLGSSTGIVIVVVVGSCLLRPLLVVDAWFRIKVAAKPAVLIRTGALVIAGTARVAIPLFGGGVQAVAWTYVGEAALGSVALYIGYRRRSPRHVWRVTRRGVVGILREFAPLMLVSSSSLIFTRLDQVMLAWLSSLAETGRYALAASLAEAPRIALLALFISVAPRLLTLRKEDPERYEAELFTAFRFIILLGYLLTIALIVVVAPLAELIMGAEYDGIGTLIAVLALPTPLACVGGALLFITNWERFYREAVIRTMIGAVLSLAINVALLPVLGALGAAITTLVVAFWIYFLGALPFARTRPFFWMILPALNPFSSAVALVKFLRNRRRRARELHDAWS